MKNLTSIRQATDSDMKVFIEFSLKLARYNPDHHPENCKYDDFNSVLNAIKRKAEKNFTNHGNDTIILIAELENKPAGYAMGRIVHEEETADNGTGKTGLFDELFVDEAARGYKLGQQLTDGIISWMKANGIKRVKLQAYSWNTTATELYERNGFVKYASSFEKYI
jgi:ribosomal protein S18 acetylase RimI-like enzyme